MLRLVRWSTALADEVGVPLQIGVEPVLQEQGVRLGQVEGQPSEPAAARPDSDASIAQPNRHHGGAVFHGDGGCHG